MWFNQYPYKNLEDFNLDYILNQLRTMKETLTNFINLNTIKFANPIQWNISKQYEANTVVVDPNDGTAYISVAPVPLGVTITNTDYWTPIFTLNFGQLNNNITLRDDGSNPLATFTSVVGDWLLWNGLLYKVTQNINVNESYVVGYNIDRYTVELFLNDAIAAITTLIGDLSNLNTSDKTTIVNAINEVFAKATNAETYGSASLLGLDSTGVNDCSNALSLLADNVALKAGTYKIASDCTINAQIVMCGSAVFDIDTGVTLTLNKQIEANPNVQIFSGNGNVIINGYAYPEWFGAIVNDINEDCSGAINKAYTSANELRLNGGYYYVTSTVYFNKSGVKVSGIGSGRSFDNPKSQSVICSTDTFLTILSIGNSAGLWNGLYEDFGVYRTVAGVDGAIGIKIYNTLLSHFVRIFSRSTTAFYCTANVTPMFDECIAFPRAQDISGVNLYGFYFKNDEVNPANGLTGNPSTYINNCSVSGQAPGIAYELAFSWTNGLSDLFINGLETSTCNRGLQIDGDGVTSMHDISVKNVVIDNYSNFAIRVINCSDAEVVIDGGYLYGAQTPYLLNDLTGNIVIKNVNVYMASTNPAAVYRIDNCIGVTMRDNICHCNSLLNVATLSSKIISEDLAIIESAGSTLIYAANIARARIKLSVSGSGTYTYGFYAGNSSNSEINVTLLSASQVATGLAYIAGTTYNTVGAAGSNEITGIYA